MLTDIKPEKTFENKIDFRVIKENKKKHLKQTLKRFYSNKLFMIGVVIVFILLVVAIFANFLAPYDPFAMDSKNTFATFSRMHPLGTDEFGRDVLSRLIFGARISIKVGLISTSISALLGILIGAFAGFYGGLTDNILMRFMDAVFSFPAILLAIVLVAVLGPSLTNAMIAIGIIYTPIFARVVRSSVITNKENEYVEAARAIGQSNIKILFLHIMPNCLSPIIVQATVTFAEAIIIEAGLSFIGLGSPPPNPSWGEMLNSAKDYLQRYPLLSVAPGLALSISVLGLNLIGDGLRDVLDPRLRRSVI
jgi:peptide/nickel transport system permease protein